MVKTPSPKYNQAFAYGGCRSWSDHSEHRSRQGQNDRGHPRTGHACIAVSGPVEMVITLETGSADREANMWTFARRAVELLRECVAKA